MIWKTKAKYLFTDDLQSPVSDFVSEQFAKQILSIKPKKGKVISGTLGLFNIKDFDKIEGGIVDV